MVRETVEVPGTEEDESLTTKQVQNPVTCERLGGDVTCLFDDTCSVREEDGCVFLREGFVGSDRLDIYPDVYEVARAALTKVIELERTVAELTARVYEEETETGERTAGSDENDDAGEGPMNQDDNRRIVMREVRSLTGRVNELDAKVKGLDQGLRDLDARCSREFEELKSARVPSPSHPKERPDVEVAGRPEDPSSSTDESVSDLVKDRPFVTVGLVDKVVGAVRESRWGDLVDLLSSLTSPTPASSSREVVLRAMRVHGEMHVDEISRLPGVPVSVSQVLNTLRRDGSIEKVGRKKFRIASDDD